MYNIKKLENNYIYIGCSDRKIQFFESAYPVPDGISYNSYLLKDTKNVLFDTVDKACCSQFFENLESALSGENLDYLVVHHMEPDHAALIKVLTEKYPEIKILCSMKSKDMLGQFFDIDTDKYVQIVKDGDILNTGCHELIFIMAPMVHWPEVMVTYDKTAKALLSADAFGSFGAINGNFYDDEIDINEYLNEARRYYANIVGKYGVQVQNLLKKVSAFDIKIIYPLHSVAIRKHIKEYIDKYSKWSAYEPEEKGVLIAYSSVYGNTENAVEILSSKLADKGVKNIKMYNVSYTDYSKVLAEAFKYSHIILATTTYNMGVFETMQNFMHSLISHNLQNRKFVLIDNGSWAPTCGGQMKTELEKLKGSEFITDTMCIKSSLKENQIDTIELIADKIVSTI